MQTATQTVEIVVPPEMAEYWETANPGVVKYPAPVLREQSRPVRRVSPGVQALIDRMLKVMRDSEGLGFAAPQVGKLERVIIVASVDHKAIPLVNPEIVSRSDETITGQEGCLSLPGLYGDVERHETVEVRGLDRKGRAVRLTLSGMAARVAQHEIDHLDGVLFTDRAVASTLHWQIPTEDDEQI
jgi:peptide deformylase